MRKGEREEREDLFMWSKGKEREWVRSEREEERQCAAENEKERKGKREKLIKREKVKKRYENDKREC